MDQSAAAIPVAGAATEAPAALAGSVGGGGGLLSGGWGGCTRTGVAGACAAVLRGLAEAGLEPLPGGAAPGRFQAWLQAEAGPLAGAGPTGGARGTSGAGELLELPPLPARLASSGHPAIYFNGSTSTASSGHPAGAFGAAGAQAGGVPALSWGGLEAAASSVAAGFGAAAGGTPRGQQEALNALRYFQVIAMDA